MASEFDIMIVGGGPAGLSAASSVVRQDHKTVLFDSGEYRNAESKYMHTVPTWDHRDPAEFRAAATADFDRYGTVTVENVKIQSIKQRGDGAFDAASADGRTWIAKKVVLATGVEDIFPDIPGYEECWVSGIFHCLYCHGWEVRGAESAGVLAEGDCASVVVALHVARQALRLSKSVTIYTNGNEELGKGIEEALETGPAPMTVDTRKIAKFVKEAEDARVTVHLNDGDSKTEAFIGHKPRTRLRGNLGEQLGVELTSQSALKVNPPFNQTNIRGVFAAGDCSSAMQTVTTAIWGGTCAGGGAPLQLQAETYNQKALF